MFKQINLIYENNMTENYINIFYRIRKNDDTIVCITECIIFII